MATVIPLVVKTGEVQQIQSGDSFVIPNGSTATTQSANDNSTKVATTAYVDAVAAALVKISTATASSSATIDFTGLSSTYNSYWLVVTDVVCATSGAAIWVRIGTGGTPTYQSGASDYTHTRNANFVTGTGTTSSNSAAGDGDDAQIVISGAATNNGATLGFSGDIRIFNPSQATGFHPITWQMLVRTNEATPNTNYVTGGSEYKATTAVTAIRIMMSTGNITSGTFTLYGLK